MQKNKDINILLRFSIIDHIDIIYRWLKYYRFKVIKGFKLPFPEFCDWKKVHVSIIDVTGPIYFYEISIFRLHSFFFIMRTLIFHFAINTSITSP